MAKTKRDGLTVYRLGAEEPVRFAAAELARYLRKMTGGAVRTRAARAYDAAAPGVWVGAAGAFGAPITRDVAKLVGCGLPHQFDDAILVRAAGGHAIVTGINARSVVFAAYRYLEELGCRWLRPGRDGERVPTRKSPLARRVRVAEAPTYRHRCICIEGSCSEAHVRDMIDYAAKRGFNAYFFQFRDSYTFLNRWYSEERTRGKNTRPLSQKEALRICDRAKADCHKRGMIIHRVGHGWTCDPFGIVANEWAPTGQKVPAKTRKLFAQVKGKRELWGGIPLNTQLCYSNPHVREAMAQAVADYCAEHRDEEIVHFWLADGANNFCECAKCRGTRPSDFYVQILNRMDELLTERGLPTRIVFLAYVNLLWGPQRRRLRNPERFILMFAPITRTYSTALMEDRSRSEKVGPYVCNKVEFPRSPRANLELLDGWRKHFDADCVDFDYHLWRDHWNDPGQTALAEVLFKDVRDLGKLGMNGFISCQVQRVFFPTGLYMHVMGKGLWDARANYPRMVADYFRDTFGARGGDVLRYLKKLTVLFDPPFLRDEKKGKAARARAVRSFEKVAGHVDAFLPAIRRGCRSADRTTAAQWRLVREHAWYVRGAAEIYAAAFAGDGERALKLFAQWEKGLWRRLPRLHHVLDVFHAIQVMKAVLYYQGIIKD